MLAISYGAKDALDAAFAPAGAHDRLRLLIPGHRLTRADLESFARQRDRRLRVAILAGRYDAANLPTARNARLVLTGAGHTVDSIAVPEGHNPTTWRDHLRDVLVSLYCNPVSFFAPQSGSETDLHPQEVDHDPRHAVR